MKRKNNIKKYPFLLMIIISTIVFTMIGVAGKNNIYSEYKVALQKTPMLAAVFEGAGEGIYPWMIVKGYDKKEVSVKEDKNSGIASAKPTNSPVSNDHKSVTEKSDNNSVNEDLYADGSDPSNEVKNQQTDKTKITENEPKKDDQTKPDDSTEKETKTNQDNGTDNGTENKTDKKNTASYKDKKNRHNNDKTSPSSGDKKGNSEVDKIQKNPANDPSADKTYQFQMVSKKYFNDALFIGDSRTVGLSEYSILNNSTFYADVGLTIYDIFNRKIAKVDGNKETILQALGDKKYKKIYIMLGINELGRGTTETFTGEYKKVLDKIGELQPQAIIFVEGIMNVSKEKSDTDPIFNNKNIRERNGSIARLANNENIFYIDVNEAITDKRGNLPQKYTFDNIHLKAAYYDIWTDFLLKHGIVEE